MTIVLEYKYANLVFLTSSKNMKYHLSSVKVRYIKKLVEVNNRYVQKRV